MWIIWQFFFSVRYSELYRVNPKKHETLSNNPSTHISINRINNIIVFKTIDGYKLEIQTPGTMKLFGSTNKLIDQTINEENAPSLEVVEVASVQYNLVGNQH